MNSTAENAGSGWSRRKKDAAPRGVSRHRSGVWAARFFCGAGHRHQERVGTIKSEAVRVFYERRARAHDEPGSCPTVERQQARVEQARQVALRQHATEYLARGPSCITAAGRPRNPGLPG
jgi:hypothetical protein